MIKRLLYIFLLASSTLMAQSGTNKWIDYTKPYFKFPVLEDGMYKITKAAFANAGLLAISTEKIQVFARGEEQYIYVEDGGDQQFDDGDYILVYGKKNDGYFDNQLYDTAVDNPNPYYSLYNDTIYYFVTYSNSTNTKRYDQDIDNNFGAHSPSPYFTFTDYKSYHSQYSGGTTNSVKTYYPKYTRGEGWVGPSIRFHGDNVFLDSIETPHYNSAGGLPTFELTVSGLTNDPSLIGDHTFKLYYNDILQVDSTYEGHHSLSLNYTIPANKWGSRSRIKLVADPTTSYSEDRSAVGYIKVTYPRSFNMENATSMFMKVYNGTNKALLEISNFNAQNSEAYLFDLTNHLKISILKSGNLYKALVPNTVANSKDCFLTSDAACITINSLEPVNGTSKFFTNYKDSSLTHFNYDYYIISTKEFSAETQAYKTYRNSSGYKATVVDVDELYLQYADGIKKHPLAIRNFAKDMVKNWGIAPPKYFFLVGKSVQPGHPDNVNNSNSISLSSRQNAANYALNKVPTYGHPGSDVYLTSQISDTAHYESEIPIGRISVTTGAEVLEYLAKVKEYETAPTAFWMKRVMHFGGGNDIGQGNTFAAYLNEFKATIEDTLYGGKVNTYLKNTTDPLQMNLSDSIRANINDGTSLMTFFGHAYGTGFDQNIDGPSAYNNQGKYPLILANSCLIGNIHLPTTNSGSEQWVFEPQKGAIGFLASVSLGIPDQLHAYSGFFYKNLSLKHYGEGLGNLVRHTVIDVQNTDKVFGYTTAAIQDVCMLMTLHADPAIVLNTHAKPDYTIYGPNGLSQPMVTINPIQVSTQDEKFTITAVISNIGKAIGDSIDIRLIRKFPTGSQDSIYIQRIAGVRFQSTVTFTLPVDILNGVGINHFTLDVDCYYKVDELDDVSNNTYSFDLNIKSADISPIYPYNYAIVPTKATPLKASTSDPLAISRKYVFQIDTCKNFNSPSLYTTSITSGGGVVELDPTQDPALYLFYNKFPTVTTLAAPTVFFWRVSLDSSYTHAFNWKNSSFQYVQNKSGWGQAHFQQWEENNFNFLSANPVSRKFSFLNHVRELYVQTSGYAGSTGYVSNLWRLDGSLKGYWKWSYDNDARSTTNLLQVAVIDHTTLEPWEVNFTPDYNQINSKGEDLLNAPPYGQYTYWYQTACNDQGPKGNYFDGINDLIDAAQDSDYIAIYTYRQSNFKDLFNNRGAEGAKFKVNMQDLGADVDSLSKFATNCEAYPYIIIAQKGNPSFAKQTWGINDYTEISVTADLQNFLKTGSVKSSLIGPSKGWNAFYWEANTDEAGNYKDTLRVNVYGVDNNSNEVLIHSYIGAQGSDLKFDTIANAATYQFIRLEAFLIDDSLHTPYQLKRWQIVFDEIPELALNAKVNYTINADSLQEGNNLRVTIAITNTSTANADSVQVVYWFVNNNTTKGLTYRMLPPLAAGQTYIDTFYVNTMGINGDNRFWYEVNPYTGPKPWQIEQYHFNNILDLPFKVYPDKQNPLLDVAFDGIHILNGDIVKPHPHVSIALKDENPYLLLDQKGLFTIKINRLTSGGLVDSTYTLDTTQYQLVKAGTANDNRCVITFDGDFWKAGKYELIVKAIDRSANKSGDGDGTSEYRIQFEVVLKSTITEVLNWPNPFTTSTQFVFTLTGSEIPDDFRIEIMNISGKIVKQITKEDIGPINIGRNITQYKWNGTDDFGDPLGNGVYLYRVVARINGQNIEKREVNISTDSGPGTLESEYFKQGWGKLYIMR